MIASTCTFLIFTRNAERSRRHVSAKIFIVRQMQKRWLRNRRYKTTTIRAINLNSAATR